jgi:hypothetical protein
MRVDNSTGKGTSGMDKFSSKVHRVHVELGGELLNSLRIKTQFLEISRLESLQSESECYRWCHSHPSKRMMWRVTEAP